MVQRVDVIRTTFLVAVAETVLRVRSPGVTKLNTAFNGLITGAVFGVGQVGVQLAAVNCTIAGTVWVVCPVVALVGVAGVTEDSGVIDVRAALNFWVAGRAKIILKPSLAWAASSRLVADAKWVCEVGVVGTAEIVMVTGTLQGVIQIGLPRTAGSLRVALAV